MTDGSILPIKNPRILARRVPPPVAAPLDNPGLARLLLQACLQRRHPQRGAPISITRLTAIGWYGRPLGCHYGWYNPRRIQAGLGGLSPEEYEDAYHRTAPDPHR